MEFVDAVRGRKMVRNFDGRAVDPAMVDRLLALAAQSPSAGNSQGWSFVVLEGQGQTARFWDTTLPAERRATFPWPGLLHAPVLIIPLAEPGAYVERYGESDKAHTGLGEGTDRWAVPYWFVDTAFAAMVVLLGAVDAELGALFFGLFDNEEALLAELGVPEGHRAIGAIALGYAAAEQRPSRSASRPPKASEALIHRGGW